MKLLQILEEEFDSDSMIVELARAQAEDTRNLFDALLMACVGDPRLVNEFIERARKRNAKPKVAAELSQSTDPYVFGYEL